MGRRRCCCPVDCAIAEDDFNRADSGDPGTLWREVTGDWSIVDNYLHCVSEGLLITTARPPVPKRGTKYNVWFRVYLKNFPASGTKSWGVVCGYRDETDYDWIELTYDAATGEMWPTFYNVDTVLMEPADYPMGQPWLFEPGTSEAIFRFCYADVHWSVNEDSAQEAVWWERCGGGQSGLPPGLGMVGFLKGDFDSFHLEEHWESDADCPYCNCFCLNPENLSDWSCLPETVTATLIPTSDWACPEMDYREFTLYQSYPTDTGDPSVDKSPRKHTWFSMPFDIEGVPHWLVIGCSGRWLMNVLMYPDTDIYFASAPYLYFTISGPPWYEEADYSVSTCSPLYLVFRDLTAAVTTCNLPGNGGTGLKPRACPSAYCLPGNPDGPTWDVEITS